MRALTLPLLLWWMVPWPGQDSAIAANSKARDLLVESDSISWPAGTEVLRFENLEGVVLVNGRLRGLAGVDSTGPLVLDTGAGFLALDLGLARVLGLVGGVGASESEAVHVTERALPRLVLGGWTMDQIQPVLTVDAGVIRRVTDRPVLGLIGHKPLRDRAVWIDYREQVVAFIPPGPSGDIEQPQSDELRPQVPEPLGAIDRASMPLTSVSAITRARARFAATLTPRAVAIPFRLVGDGKMLVHGAVSDPRPPRFSARLNFIVDTGATKSVLFEDALEGAAEHAAAWPALRGLTAPTLIGPAEARIARVPVTEIEAAHGRLRLKGVDFGVVGGELGEVLSRATQKRIHGLLGYSFLKRFRLLVDYPDSVLWLDPIPGYRDDRPLEYCHVGIQLERQDGAIIITGVVADSPAARAGIARGDELVAIDGAPARPLDLVTLTRRMEGAPGRSLTLVTRRSAVERTHKLVRRCLL